MDALFEQAGVIRTDTLHELLGAAALLSAQPVPRGARVAIVTNAGGPGILCADACQADGVEVPELTPDVRAILAEFLPAEAALGNPIDMIATASADHYRRTLHTLIEANACDVILVLFVPPLATQATDVAIAIRDVARSSPDVPIAAVFMTSDGPPRSSPRRRYACPATSSPRTPRGRSRSRPNTAGGGQRPNGVGLRSWTLVPQRQRGS